MYYGALQTQTADANALFLLIYLIGWSHQPALDHQVKDAVGVHPAFGKSGQMRMSS
jgi:hypothetical protein